MTRVKNLQNANVLDVNADIETGATLTICGHVHWPSARWGEDANVVNVCERVLVLTAA